MKISDAQWFCSVSMRDKPCFKKALLMVVVIYFIVTLILRFLANQGNSAPEALEPILRFFTEHDIEQGLQYRRSGFLVSLLAKCISTVLMIAFVFTPLSQKIENYFAQKTNHNFVIVSFCFLMTYLVIETLIFLPFSYYFGFVREHQFGFSTLSRADWALTTLKSIGVNAALTLPLEIGALLLLKWFHRTWIFIVPAAYCVVQLFLTAIWPNVITPLFYDYAPLEDGTLRQKITALAEKATINVENVFIINESKYSNHTNAYFSGWGSNKKIFLYDTLIAKHTEDEVISVLGHEIGHWQRDHSLKDLVLSTVLVFIAGVLLVRIFALAKREGTMHLNDLHSPSTLPFIFLLLSCFSLVSTPLISAISRAHEAEADMAALTLTDNKQSFIESEIKLARHNKAMLNPHPLVVWFSYSHPPTIQRILMAEGFERR